MDNPVEGKLAEIYGVSSAVKYDLADGPPSCRGLLDPMPAKPIGEHQVGDHWVSPDYGILVQRVVVIVARPCTLNLHRAHKTELH